jgi:hypothetical protein
MFKRTIAALILGVAVLGSVVPASAQDRGVSAARAAALRQCSLLSERYPETTWSSYEFQLYGACMAQHGQVD